MPDRTRGIRALSDWLRRISTGWVALAATALFAVFVAFVLPAQTPILSAEGVRVGSPDLSLLYSADDLYAIADSYGADGRAEYIRARVTFDVMWPLVFVAFLATAISWVSRVLRPGSAFMNRANLMPVLVGVFDYLENVCTVVVMSRYPARAPVAAVLAPVMTLSKWVTLSAAFAVLVAGLAILAWQRVRDPKRRTVG